MIRIRFTSLFTPVKVNAYSLNRIERAFELEARKIIIGSIQEVLGNPSLLGYDVSPEYGRRKPGRRGFRRIPGKSATQPLIFDAEKIFDALLVEMHGDTLEVKVDPSKGMDGAFDVAEYWESGEGSDGGFAGTHYLEKGVERCENKLAFVLGEIIFREWGF